MKKTNLRNNTSIKKTDISNIKLQFSFLYFDKSDREICPLANGDDYLPVLIDRLQELSAWTAKEFTNCRSKSLRVHTHDWEKTTRPKGFQHLNSELQSYPGWQFQLTANKYGRIHGILIGHLFYIIWLDKDHKLYQ